MSATISKVSTINVGNGKNVTPPVHDKNHDVEKGELHPDVEHSASNRPRPASSCTATSADGRVVFEDNLRRKPVGSVRVEVEVAGDAPLEEKRSSASSRAGTSWRTVGRVLCRLTVAMLLFTGLAAVLAVLAVYAGYLFLAQLLVVVLVAYLVAGGRFRWIYVALMTLPRDAKGVIIYIKVLWFLHTHQRKNRSVADVFRENVNRHPNKVCLIYEDQEWTFQQVEEFSNKVANVFKSHGYRKGDVVALFIENRLEYIGIWLGLSKLGVISSLINTNLRKNTLLHSINVANCQALIYGVEFADAISDITESLDAKVSLYRFGNAVNSTIPNLNEKDLTAVLTDASPVLPVLQEKGCFNDKMLYIYTSGTTGLPKAAVITNARFMFMTVGIYHTSQIRSTDRIYTPLPLYHTAGGVIAVGSTLLCGGTTVIKKKFSASAYITDCIKYKCTVGQYIGEMCRYILAVPPKPEDTKHNIRVMFGNGLRPQIWGEFRRRFKIPRIAEFYGATEGNANIVNIDNTEGAIGFMSRILPSVYPISIIKVDQDGEPIRNAKGLCQVCGPDEPGVFVGKIIHNNPSRSFEGYVDKKASEKKVVHDVFTKGDSAFISGDILVADEFGYLYFKDRTGDTFRWKGENVSTSEVEGIMSNIINYRDCIVYGVEIRGAEGRTGMAAIHDADSTLDLNRLAVDMKDHLPVYARPQFIRILTKIDLTGTFKLKKKDLQNEGYDPRRIGDKLYYLDAKSGYQLLTEEIYDKIQDGKIRF